MPVLTSYRFIVIIYLYHPLTHLKVCWRFPLSIHVCNSRTNNGMVSSEPCITGCMAFCLNRIHFFRFLAGTPIFTIFYFLRINTAYTSSAQSVLGSLYSKKVETYLELRPRSPDNESLLGLAFFSRLYSNQFWCLSNR